MDLMMDRLWKVGDDRDRSHGTGATLCRCFSISESLIYLSGLGNIIIVSLNHPGDKASYIGGGVTRPTSPSDGDVVGSISTSSTITPGSALSAVSAISASIGP
jgi:hypothetical protein